jgi:hypothetical protein
MEAWSLAPYLIIGEFGGVSKPSLYVRQLMKHISNF